MNRDDNILWDIRANKNGTWLCKNPHVMEIKIDGRVGSYQEYTVNLSSEYYKIGLTLQFYDDNEAIDEDDLLFDLARLTSLGYYGCVITCCIGRTTARYYEFGDIDGNPVIIIRDADFSPLDTLKIINIAA